MCSVPKDNPPTNYLLQVQHGTEWLEMCSKQCYRNWTRFNLVHQENLDSLGVKSMMDIVVILKPLYIDHYYL